jgi:hypothetical protein
MSTTDLASLYESMIATSHTVERSKVSVARVSLEDQCYQVDELAYELDACIHKWRGYSDAFVATRFVNMHYARTVSTGSAYPEEEVWQHILKRIGERRHHRVVFALPRLHQRVIRQWS